MISDLTYILQLEAHLLARPEGVYLDGRSGEPCRHPGGLYSQSLSKVLSRMRELTDTIEPHALPDTRRTTWPTTMSALEALFLAIDSHADDLKTVVSTSASLSSKKRTQLYRLIDDIVKELSGRPINRIKHNGERLEACFCFNRQFAVYGYFIAGVRDDGAIAPSDRAHGSSGKQWSVAVTLRRQLGQLVQAAAVVYPHVRSTLVLPSATWSETQRSDLHSIAAWLQLCPPYCFPNEGNVRVPDVGLRDGEPYLRLETLKKLRSVHTQPDVTWSRSFTSDGVSRRFAVD